MDFKSRVRNVPFWMGMLSIAAILGQTTGLYKMPDDWQTTANTIFGILAALGVLVNPTTPGITDK